MAALVVIGVGSLLRLVWLEADPDYYMKWAGFITDEGRWIENVRALLLGGELFLPRLNLHLLISPLFQAANYIVFQLLEINRFSARLFTALCGIGILVLFWRSLLGVVAPYALVLGLALLAAQEDLVILSRLCIPEVPASLAALGSFVVLMNAAGRRRYVLFAGILMMVCIGLKATMGPLLLIFGVIVLLYGTPNGEMRWRRVFLFWLPALACTCLALVVGLAVSAGDSPAGLGSLRLPMGDLAVLWSFVGLESPYGIISFPFEKAMAPTVNVWLLGAWLGAIVTVVSPGRLEPIARRWFAASAIWAVGYVLLMQSLSYFPDRYKVHFLLPLAILATVGIHSFLRVGLMGVCDVLGQLAPPRRVLAVGLLVIPAAVLVAPGVVFVLDSLGLSAGRLRWKMLAIGAAWIMLVPAVYRRARSARSQIAILVPLAAFGAWFAGHQLLGWKFWPEPGQATPLEWIMTIGIAAGVIGLLSRWNAARDHSGRLVLATALACLVISLAPYGQSLFWPRFTARDASQDLGILLADYNGIVSCGADGMFIDNDLEHLSEYRVDTRDSLPRIVLMLQVEKDFCPTRLRNLLDTHYQILKSYELYMSPRSGVGAARVTVHALTQEPHASGLKNSTVL